MSPNELRSVDALAAAVGHHADRIAENRAAIAALDERADLVDVQLAVWKGQLRMLAAIAGLVGGSVGGLVSALAGA